MKFLRFSLAALIAALSLAAANRAVAQNASSDSNATARTSAQTSSAVTERYMTSVETELTGKLDSKNAAVGQQVTARTRQNATLADGTRLPKGTKLTGHITAVQAHSKDQPYATLAMTFDRAELAGGKTVSLRSVMRTVAPPAALSASDNTFADPSSPMGGVGAGASASGGGSMGASPGGRGGLGAAGGGGLGGGLGGPVRGVGQTAGSAVGGVGADTRSTIGAVDRTADSVVGVTGGVVSKAGETLSEAPHATGLPGVMLSSSASGSADVSGTLTAEGRNVTLDSGTQITLSVIAR